MTDNEYIRMRVQESRQRRRFRRLVPLPRAARREPAEGDGFSGEWPPYGRMGEQVAFDLTTRRATDGIPRRPAA